MERLSGIVWALLFSFVFPMTCVQKLLQGTNLFEMKGTKNIAAKVFFVVFFFLVYCARDIKPRYRSLKKKNLLSSELFSSSFAPPDRTLSRMFPKKIFCFDDSHLESDARDGGVVRNWAKLRLVKVHKQKLKTGVCKKKIWQNKIKFCIGKSSCIYESRLNFQNSKIGNCLFLLQYNSVTEKYESCE